MDVIVVPGVNGLGVTKGVENGYCKMLENGNFNLMNLNNQNIVDQLSQISIESKKYFDKHPYGN